MIMLEMQPLLEVQRELLSVPPGQARFDAYLKVTLNEARDGYQLPLANINPMAKSHVAEFLDQLIAFDAEAILQTAIDEALTRLDFAQGYQVGLVVIDDARGGWTNRYLNDLHYRLTMPEMKMQWLAVYLWSGEVARYDAQTIKQACLQSIYRAWHMHQNGQATSLAELLRQEGRAMAFADLWSLGLDQDDLDYSREVIVPYLNETKAVTLVACLYGDEAAREVGAEPLGLSANAGLAVALQDALEHAQG